jgi:hypothetical protein
VEYEIDGVTGLWIVDGQHRYRVLMDHGFGEWIVEVKIHLDVKDDARASDLFIKLNSRASVQPFDKFKNARTAGYENAVRITRIAKDCGLEVARQAGDGKICCVSALTQAYAIDGGQTLIAALETLVAAWGRTAASVEGKLIEGVAAVYKTYKDGIDRPALVKKLGKYPGGATGLLGDAKGLRQYRHLSVGRCVAERIVEVYNSGRKVGRLDPL